MKLTKSDVKTYPQSPAIDSIHKINKALDEDKVLWIFEGSSYDAYKLWNISLMYIITFLEYTHPRAEYL